MYSLYCYTKVLLDKSIDYLTYRGESDTSSRIYPSNTGSFSKVISLYSNMSQICPNIYLGNSYNARNYYNLEENNIGLIVNCTAELDNHFPDHFQYLKVPIRDSSNSSILEYLDDTLDQVHTYLENNRCKSVLFHCFMGSSRSSSILVAYLVKYMDLGIEEAISLVREIRPIVNINSSFYRELKLIYS